MKVHLMYPDRDFDPEADPPAGADDLTDDLGLVTVWAAMANGNRHLYDVGRAATLAWLTDPATIAYRQQVLSDCRAQPDVVGRIYQIATEAVAGEKRIYGFLRRTPSGTLRRSIEVLELVVDLLRRLRQIAGDHVTSFRSEGMHTLLAMVVDELDDQYFETIGDQLKRLRFRGGLWMSARLGRGNRGVDYVLRVPEGSRQGWKERLGFGQPPSYSFEIAPRDEAGHRSLNSLTDRGINLVANALGQSTDHILAFLLQLRAEVGFYLGCLELERALAERGEPTCTPEPRSPGEHALSATGLYDGSLALKTGEPVVGNNLDADGKMLVMVTGANSGGKSTFLRSVGLAQLMMQCGMPVCATSYRASVGTSVSTHFAREEDSAMESGRFDEELSRMSALADRLRPHAMVLFNESFASTDEWEGSEIARQVVAALLESDVRVLFVTHLFDLADGLQRDEAWPSLFLRAERLDDGTRTYRVVEGAPLATSFGADVFERLGGWEHR